MFEIWKTNKKQKFFLPYSGDKCSRSSRYVWYQLVWNRSSEYFHAGVWHLIYKMSSLNSNTRGWDLSNWANTENLTHWHLPNLTLHIHKVRHSPASTNTNLLNSQHFLFSEHKWELQLKCTFVLCQAKGCWIPRTCNAKEGISEVYISVCIVVTICLLCFLC